MSHQSTQTQPLAVQPIASELFQLYGQLIVATEDGAPYGVNDAQLRLQNGIPRFYIMRLSRKGLKFSQITRHAQCTQCLGSLEGKDWIIAVAPPSQTSHPALETIAAFRVPGNCFIKLDVGTWHAGPYFEHEFVDFYNLELSDTNVVDHDTCDLTTTYGVEFEFVE